MSHSSYDSDRPYPTSRYPFLFPSADLNSRADLDFPNCRLMDPVLKFRNTIVLDQDAAASGEALSPITRRPPRCARLLSSLVRLFFLCLLLFRHIDRRPAVLSAPLCAEHGHFREFGLHSVQYALLFVSVTRLDGVHTAVFPEHHEGRHECKGDEETTKGKPGLEVCFENPRRVALFV